MDATPSYQVILSGKLREGFEPAQVKQALAERLKLPKPQLEQLFGGKPLVLKRTASAEEAKKLAAALARMGAVATIRAAKASTAGKGAITLPDLPAASSGAMLKGALYLAMGSTALFTLLYLLLLLTFSVGVIYSSLFTTWGMSVTGFGLLALLLQLLTIPLGLAVLFLIAKPLLSLRARGLQGEAISEVQEPKLHALVAALCDKLDAPMPQQIRINNSNGVALGYAGGPGAMLRRGQVLNIGAPVVAACNISQLTALIAQAIQQNHSKGLSPRALCLLRRNDAWLQRAVEGEDGMDRILQELIEEGSPLAPLARGVQKAIAVSRQPLRWYLRLSRRLSRRTMHRLVYNADRVAQAVAGSDGFQQLLRQQRLLAYSAKHALPGLRARWYKEGKLPQNLVQLLLHHSRSLPSDSDKKLLLKQEQERAASLDLLPADTLRLQHLAQERVGAAYPAPSPATTLFRNFTKLSRSMTLRLYYNELEIPVRPDQLLPSTTPDMAKQQQPIDALFNGMYVDLLPLKLGHRMNLVGDFEEGVSARAKALKEISTTHSHTQLAHKRCMESEQALFDISVQNQLYHAELWKQWGLPAEDKEGINQIHQACREQEKGLVENIGLLAHQLQPNVQRLAVDLALLGMPQAARVKNAAMLSQEVTGLIAVLERIEHAAQQLRELRLHVSLLQILLSFDGTTKGKRGERIQEQAGDIRQLLTGLSGSFKTTPYPFGTSYNNLTAFVLHQAYRDDSPEGELDRGMEMVERITALQRQILARLCAIALHVEKGLGL